MNDIIGATMLFVLLSQVSNVRKFQNNLDIDLSKGYWYIESIQIIILHMGPVLQNTCEQINYWQIVTVGDTGGLMRNCN